jgi:hypothetical protein
LHRFSVLGRVDPDNGVRVDATGSSNSLICSYEIWSGFYVLLIANRTPVWYKCSDEHLLRRRRVMRVVRLPDTLAQVLSERKPTLLIGASHARAVVLSVDDYERLVAVYDWHERLLKGA